MRLRPYIPDSDFDIIKNWITGEREHALWCADRFAFPDRVDPFAGKVEYDMTKTGRFQFFDVFSFR